MMNNKTFNNRDLQVVLDRDLKGRHLQKPFITQLVKCIDDTIYKNIRHPQKEKLISLISRIGDLEYVMREIETEGKLGSAALYLYLENLLDALKEIAALGGDFSEFFNDDDFIDKE